MPLALLKQDRIAAAIGAEAPPGFAAAIDEAATQAAPEHRFLRRAWYAARERDGAATLIGRRGDGRVFAAIPTIAYGPAVAGLRAVPGPYWPFRAFPLAADAGIDDLAALLASRAARAALGQAWRVGPLCRDDPLTVLLVQAARRAGWTILSRPLGRSFVLDLAAAAREGAWPGRSMLRRFRSDSRKLEGEGEVSVRQVRGAGWSGAVFDDLAAIEARSWIGRETDRSGAKFMNAANRAFWETAVADQALAAMLSATILDVGGRPAAFSFDLDAGTLQYGIASSYDEDFARFGAGKLVTHHHLLASLARGTERIDWGAGDSGYKRALGAVPGSELVDCLFVRNRPLAALLRAKWQSPVQAGADRFDETFGRDVQLLLASLGMAAAAVAFAE